MRLLVVDDNDEITGAVTFYCGTEKDIDCRVINNGPEGLESIRKDKFDLILLDIAMPEFSGFDVIRSLKQDRIIESKNIVIFTASSDQTILNEMRNSGIKEILKKPFSLADLTELIEIPSWKMKVS